MRVPPSVLPLLLAGGSVALAQSASPLKLLLGQALVTAAQQDGKPVEKLLPAPGAVKPGDVLEEQLSASNVGPRKLNNATLTLPVPRGTQYLGSASAPGPRWTLTFSFDGGKTFGAEPLKQKVTVTENGKTLSKEVTVPPSAYTHARWTVATLNPDETLKFSFRVKVK